MLVFSLGSESLNSKPKQEQNDHQETKRSIFESMKPGESQTNEQHRYDYPPSSHTGHEPHYEKGGKSWI